MGKGLGRKVKDVKGKRFGKLSVIRRAGTQKRPNRTSALWRCKCDCGTFVIRTVDNLCDNSSCGCDLKLRAAQLGRSNKGRTKPGTAKRNLLARYKHNAKIREIPWQLSDLEFYELISQSCHYTAEPPSSIIRTKSGETYTYSGIDRKDPNVGYTPENCIPCCKEINKMKSDLPYAEFLETITKVYRVRVSGTR